MERLGTIFIGVLNCIFFPQLQLGVDESYSLLVTKNNEHSIVGGVSIEVKLSTLLWLNFSLFLVQSNLSCSSICAANSFFCPLALNWRSVL